MKFGRMMDRLINGKTVLHRMFFQPRHPSLLAFFRICYGTFMMMDVIQERGMSRADNKFGGDEAGYCAFPLIDGLKPFKFEVMVVMYAILFWNSFFVTIGYFYRLNIISYTIIYWYLFLLDTNVWNNHSYLFGLIALLLCASNAHHYMSVDNILFDSTKSNVPNWNYTLLRFQIFLVYFYAGLKKTEADWLTGYSMNRLSKEWVFDPFRSFLSNESINYWVVHIGGFMFDISVGFMLLFAQTRIIGLLLCVAFHGMNLFMFRIGMFPFVMMASSFIFCNPSSFDVLLSKICCSKSRCNDKATGNFKFASDDSIKNSVVSSRWTFSQLCTACLCLMYVALQLFLPYSHFITKGYNGWTQGLYGYSWDMMIHSFSNQQIKIMYRNLDNNDVGYLKPEAFQRTKRFRWTSQPAMAYQYAVCIKKQLKKSGINNSAIYFDVWKSMNKRFKQRIYDPGIDIANYQWSPFLKPTFVLPLMTDLEGWREETRKIKYQWRNSSNKYHVVFVADFPGLYLDNYIGEDIGNATIHVLNGQVAVHSQQISINLSAGQTIEVLPGNFHRVETVSKTPSCYYYIYKKEAQKSLARQLDEYGSWLAREGNDGGGENGGDDVPVEFSKEAVDLYHKRLVKSSQNVRKWHISKFLQEKLRMVQKSYFMFWFSLRNLLLGEPTEGTVAKETAFLNSLDNQRKHDKLQPEVESFDKVEL